jgi:hypothetical protein
VAFDAWIARFAIRAAVTTVIALLGVIAALFALPILPVERFDAYHDLLRRPPRSLGRAPIGRPPLLFADM